MPIDKEKIAWDVPKIDPLQVKWDQPAVSASQAAFSGEGIPGLRIGGVRAPNLVEAASNLPSGFMDLVHGVGELIRNPALIAKVPLGAAETGLKAFLPESVYAALENMRTEYQAKQAGVSKEEFPRTELGAQKKAEFQQVADIGRAFLQDYVDTYGLNLKTLIDWDKTVSAFEKNPVRVLGDLSGILSLVGKGGTVATAGRTGAVPATIGRFSEGMSTASRYADPLMLPLAGVNKLADVAAPTLASVRTSLSPIYNMMTPALEGRGEQYVSSLLNAPREIVPGSKRTAGEILTGEGVAGTQLPALEQKILSQYAPTQLAETEAARAKARNAEVETISGTPETRQSAAEARTAATEPLYEAAAKKLSETDETFAKLMQTPAMQEALDAASKIMANRQKPLMEGKITPATTEKFMMPNGEMVSVQVPGSTAKLTGQALQDIKLALDEAVKPRANESAPQAAQRASVAEVRAQYMDWLAENAPALETARKTFAEKSGPINVMEVGEVIRRGLQHPLKEGENRAGVFANIVQNAPGTLKKATGEPRFERLSDVLETGDSLRVARVLEDIRTAEKYKDLAKAGRAEMEGVTGAQLPTPKGMLSRIAYYANKIIEATEGRINRAAAIKIAEAAYDPARMAAMMREVMNMNAATQASIRATTPKVTNAMRGTTPFLNALALQAQSQP